MPGCVEVSEVRGRAAPLGRMPFLRRRGRHSGAAAGVAVARLALGPALPGPCPGQLPARATGRCASHTRSALGHRRLHTAPRTAAGFPRGPQPPRGSTPLHPPGHPPSRAPCARTWAPGADAARAHFVRRPARARASRQGAAAVRACAQQRHLALRGQHPASAQRPGAQALRPALFGWPSAAALARPCGPGRHAPGPVLRPSPGRGESLTASAPRAAIPPAATNRQRLSQPTSSAECGKSGGAASTHAHPRGRHADGGPTFSRGAFGPAAS